MERSIDEIREVICPVSVTLYIGFFLLLEMPELREGIDVLKKN